MFPAKISATRVTSFGAVGELWLKSEQSTSRKILHSELLKKNRVKIKTRIIRYFHLLFIVLHTLTTTALRLVRAFKVDIIIPTLTRLVT